VAALQTLRPALASAGFQVEETTGAELCAVYQPGFKPRRRGAAGRP